jgi:hypothetical protein
MREEGRIGRSSHKWRDAVDAGLPGSSVLRLALSELESGEQRRAAGRGEEEGWRRFGAMPRLCVRAALREFLLRPEELGSGDRRRTVRDRESGRVGFFLGRDMLFGWAAGEPWLARLGISGLLHSARLTREQLASWLGSARYSYQAKN